MTTTILDRNCVVLKNGVYTAERGLLGRDYQTSWEAQSFRRSTLDEVIEKSNPGGACHYTDPDGNVYSLEICGVSA